MNVTRMLMKAIVAACVLAAVSASAALALPTVSYTGTGAVTASGAEGSLETANGTTVTCKENTITAQLKGASPATEAEKVVVTFKGCKSAGKTCTTTGEAAGTIKSKASVAKVGYIKSTAPKEVGISVGANGTIEVEFKCGETINGEVKGSAIASVGKEAEYNKAAASFPAAFEKGATKGSQKFTKFEGGAEDVLEAAVTSAHVFERSNIQQTGTIKPVTGTATINA